MKMTRCLFLMILLAVVVSSATPAKRDPPIVAKCPPGSYDASQQGRQPLCRACPPGSYMNEHNNAVTCKKHRVCSKSYEGQTPGSATSDVVCKCEGGRGRAYYNVDDVYGYDCLPCKEENVSQKIAENAFDDGDTVCCPSGTVASRDGTRQLQCLATQDSRDCMASPTPQVATPKDDSTFSSTRSELIVGVVSLLIGVGLGAVITILALCLKKRRQRSKRSSKTSPPICRDGFRRGSYKLQRAS